MLAIKNLHFSGGSICASKASQMPLKSLVRELRDIRDSIGSISRRSFDVRFSHQNRVRSQSVVLDSGYYDAPDMAWQQSCWANLPQELLRDVLERLEMSDSTWPARKYMVASAAVCKTWREIIKELVKTPQECGKLTFPISLKQPGPREGTIQCFIKRDRAASLYHLYLGLTPTETGKFLLAAKKVRRATHTEYIISLNADDISRGSNTYIGKLRSNFLGTKFTIYDAQAPHDAAVRLIGGHGSRRVGLKQVSPRIPACSYNIAHVAYELNVLGTRGPRRMHCIMHSIPASAMEVGGIAPTPVELPSLADESFSSSFSKYRGADLSFSISQPEYLNRGASISGPLILKNKAPRWHEQLQCWCLNFRGRVTVASVKNFQLVAAVEPNQTVPQSEQDKILLQFGKIGKDIFTMDYRYPLSAFQAFAICLSSFDTKLACE